MVKKLLAECERQNIKLSVVNGKLRAEGVIPPAIRQKLAANKEGLIRYLVTNMQKEKVEAFHKNILKTVADNIRRGELLKVELYKGLQAGRPLDELFPLAVECIGRMTDDKHFLEETRRMLEGYQSN